MLAQAKACGYQDYRMNATQNQKKNLMEEPEMASPKI
jgi:hypothetical protein